VDTPENSVADARLGCMARTRGSIRNYSPFAIMFVVTLNSVGPPGAFDWSEVVGGTHRVPPSVRGSELFWC
jgi:hypothetical protein